MTLPESERDPDADVQREWRLYGGALPRRRPAHGCFLVFEELVEQVVGLDDPDEALAVDGQPLLNPQIQIRREAEARPPIAERANGFRTLIQPRQDHEAREMLAVLIPRGHADREVVRELARRGQFDGVAALGEHAPVRVAERVWIDVGLAKH